jgi:hypothetical protein
MEEVDIIIILMKAKKKRNSLRITIKFMQVLHFIELLVDLLRSLYQAAAQLSEGLIKV